MQISLMPPNYIYIYIYIYIFFFFFFFTYIYILAETLACDSTNETVLFQALMNEIITLPVTTVVHIPRSVRPLLAQVLSSELSHACLHGIWGFARFHLFAKAVLRCSPRGGRKKRLVVKSILLTRLKRWQEGDLIGLWEEARVYRISSLSKIKTYFCCPAEL